MVGIGGAEDDPGGRACVRHPYLPDPPSATVAVEETRPLAPD